MAAKRNDTSLFDRAVKFAADAHADTVRKGKHIPYLLHPMEAAVIVSTLTEDQELLAAAVLHDVVEDTDATLDELRILFGERVADLVASETIQTDAQGAALEAWKNDSWKERKEQTVRRLADASMDSKIVAMGDKLSNMRSLNRDHKLIGDELWKRFRNSNPADHAWYYGCLLKSLEELSDTPAYQEFQQLYEETFGGMK